jgi:hypothetical protein
MLLSEADAIEQDRVGASHLQAGTAWSAQGSAN